uniref:VOC domain-containing protein n=1 Tax=Lotharella oceanica TaxID=641309 RepID=A0A7S2TQH9_9EUKA|mmetsp:Transcript_22472/g.42209  ORF Transcript_22472/g.42209 Transcript_22472/m.42209 type:complete len:367 (+) Transcript_22472:50-1150(+)
MLLLAASSLFFIATAELPPLYYRYASFGVENPKAAAQFFSRYTGGEVISREQFLIEPTPNSQTVGVRLPFEGKFSDVYFQNDTSLPAGDMILSSFARKIATTHSMAQDDWDWWQDWHLAFSVDNLDAVALRLMKDNVPFVSRGSLYFTIPRTGLIIQVLGDATVYWKEPFLFCRKTSEELTGKMQPYTLNVTDLSTAPDMPLPEFVPSHQSLAASDAPTNAKWMQTYLNLTFFYPFTKPNESHAYAGGTCADIEWMYAADHFQFHFIQQKVKREGNLRIAAHEEYLNRLHGNLTHVDQYMLFRAALSTPDVGVYAENFAKHGIPTLMSSGDDGVKRLLVTPPNGYTIELFEDASHSPRLAKSVPQW